METTAIASGQASRTRLSLLRCVRLQMDWDNLSSVRREVLARWGWILGGLPSRDQSRPKRSLAWIVAFGIRPVRRRDSNVRHRSTLIDHKFGRIMNANIAEYHVPVNADVHDIKVIFVDEPDDIVNPLGIKGLGEIGIVGVPAAIANAIYHATGQRVRDLPITVDKLLR